MGELGTEKKNGDWTVRWKRRAEYPCQGLMVYASGSQFKQHARWCPFKDLFHSEFFVEQSLLIFPFAPENILDWIYHIRVSQGKTGYMHYPAILFPFSVNSFLGCIEMWGWERNTFENKKSLKRNLVFVFYFWSSIMRGVNAYNCHSFFLYWNFH